MLTITVIFMLAQRTLLPKTYRTSRQNTNTSRQREPSMKANRRTNKKIRWELILFFNALIAALISLTTASVCVAGIAKGLFYIFMGLFLTALIEIILQRVEA
jgi:uncharacterized membrane protein YtjA (UPF0391 family)